MTNYGRELIITNAGQLAEQFLSEAMAADAAGDLPSAARLREAANCQSVLAFHMAERLA